MNKMKLTEKQIKEIKELRNKGMNLIEIAEKFNVSSNVIGYWTSRRDKVKEWQKEYSKNLSPEKRKENYEKQKEYRKNYFRERYRDDEEFREKVKERARRYKRRK